MITVLTDNVTAVLLLVVSEDVQEEMSVDGGEQGVKLLLF